MKKKKKMTRWKWFFMSKEQRFIYKIMYAKHKKIRVDLMNGVVLDFSDNTIKEGVDYQKLSDEKKLHEWRW